MSVSGGGFFKDKEPTTDRTNSDPIQYILVVDDVSINLKIAARNAPKVLGKDPKANDVVVVAADSGEQAVEVFKRHLEKTGKSFDVVISDQDMPNMKGSEAVKKMRQLEQEHHVAPQHQSIIVGFSGNIDAKNLMQAAGADGCITTKVFVAAEIEAIIKTVHDKRLKVEANVDDDQSLSSHSSRSHEKP